MRTEKEIKRLFIKAVDSEDGHFYDADECWYCGYNDGIKATLLWFLGEGELYQKYKDGSKRMTGKRKKGYVEYYRQFKDEKSNSSYE
jgi:hypothetical protein